MELERVVDALAEMAELLTPSPVPDSLVGSASTEFDVRLCGWQRFRDEQPSTVAQLASWSAGYLDRLAELEAGAADAVKGEMLLALRCARR
jgi:hypothetical protein